MSRPSLSPSSPRRGGRRLSMQTGDPSAAAFAGEFLQRTLPLPAGGFSSGLTVTDNETFLLDGSQTLILHDIDAKAATHRGKKCTRLVHASKTSAVGLALVPGLEFQNGLIEMSFSCRSRPTKPAEAGQAGPAFRINAEGAFEGFLLNPAASRSHDQHRRNRAVQYVSLPAFPADTLCEQSPGCYAVYVDCPPAEWLSLRMEICGSKARLYLNGSSHPCLLVDDLRLPLGSGSGVGLWVPSGAEVFVADINVVHWKR